MQLAFLQINKVTRIPFSGKAFFQWQDEQAAYIEARAKGEVDPQKVNWCKPTAKPDEILL